MKDRPCAIVAARRVVDGKEIVTVVPVTHSPPLNPDDAVEMPGALKSHLGLDEQPSWVVVTETNDFIWPGPDLCPVARAKAGKFEYGMLPPRFFAHVRDRLLAAYARKKLARLPRTD